MMDRSEPVGLAGAASCADQGSPGLLLRLDDVGVGRGERLYRPEHRSDAGLDGRGGAGSGGLGPFRHRPQLVVRLRCPALLALRPGQSLRAGLALRSGRAGRSGLACRALCADRALLAGRALLACRTLCADRALLATLTGQALQAALARKTLLAGLTSWSGEAASAGLARLAASQDAMSQGPGGRLRSAYGVGLAGRR